MTLLNRPDFNPTGTSFSGVTKWAVTDTGVMHIGTHSKVYTNMMKVVGRYIKADYNVQYVELTHEEMEARGARRFQFDQIYVDVTCKPPLFA